ncbi:MAG: hypothetical protein NZU63_11125 [Gemmataceae bacterium]|nr:hypothetical protein [Gemmataceae bacterium]MDW8243639.1 hypothetical protein [Thermogemmata sp.]
MQKWFEKAVARVEAAFTPAQARPGQTVTWTFTLHLHEGYHTYPTRQTDPQAAAFVNEFRFPEPSEVIFVGAVQDPKNVQTRAEPELGILSLRYCSGVVVYSRPAVVHPQARPGPVTIKGPKVRLNICDKNNCFPTKEIDTTATLTILEGPAVPIEATYADEVRRIIDKSHPKK